MLSLGKEFFGEMAVPQGFDRSQTLFVDPLLFKLGNLFRRWRLVSMS
jgi:hypothetical protein